MQGFFDDAVNFVTGTAQSVATATSEAIDSAAAKVGEAKTKMQELIDNQAKVDAGIAKMQDGPDKTRLIALRDESRGVFSNYVLPAWKKMQAALSEDTATPKAGDSTWYNPTTWFGSMPPHGMGALPLIPIAAVAAATAMLLYVGNLILKEQLILRDPAFTAAQKASVLNSNSISSIGDAVGNMKYVLLIGAGLYALMMFKDFIPKPKSNPVRRKKKKARRV